MAEERCGGFVNHKNLPKNDNNRQHETEREFRCCWERMSLYFYFIGVWCWYNLRKHFYLSGDEKYKQTTKTMRKSNFKIFIKMVLNIFLPFFEVFFFVALLILALLCFVGTITKSIAKVQNMYLFWSCRTI